MIKLSLLLTSFFLSQSAFSGLHDVPHITLNASANIKKPADELQFKIACVSHSEDAETALEKNSQHMHEIIYQLKSLGLDSDEYETAQFSINPTYTPYPQHPPANWRPSINGYEVNNTIFVHTTQLEIVGSIIDAATKAGASSITDIRFGLKDPRQYYNEALSLAGANAIKDAQVIAKATGVKLKRVLSINLSQMRVNSPQVHMACFAKAANMDQAPPIEAGDLSIEAHVNLVYEIE